LPFLIRAKEDSGHLFYIPKLFILPAELYVSYDSHKQYYFRNDDQPTGLLIITPIFLRTVLFWGITQRRVVNLYHSTPRSTPKAAEAWNHGPFFFTLKTQASTHFMVGPGT
jgi:hypothetical protein